MYTLKWGLKSWMMIGFDTLGGVLSQIKDILTNESYSKACKA